MAQRVSGQYCVRGPFRRGAIQERCVIYVHRSGFKYSLIMPPVIYQCGLKRDLGLLEAGDATEVGEKGLTLR